FAFAGCKEPSLEETLTVPVEKASDFTISEGTWNLTLEETASEEGLGSSSTIIKGTYVVTGTNPTSAINVTITSYIEKMVAETKEAYTEAKTYVIAMASIGFTADYDEDNLTINLTANEEMLKEMSDDQTYEAFSEMLASNPLIDMLLELGSTQQIIIMTMRRVATEGFAYGKAYLDFFVKMLPSFVGIQTFYPTLAKWVIGTTAYQTKGFSIWGESYLNFGGWGIPFMFVIGRLFQKLLKVDENSSPLKISLAAVSLSFFADVSRRSISEFGFVFLYDIILPIVAIWVLSEVHKRKEI
ncbi:MAG: O-antigen polysaccharide polymerase Wzy, partial [Clostridia bacterium]|nr:O-antigen polysaccharide polymerase Wzy [Clostridia bacterium]